MQDKINNDTIKNKLFQLEITDNKYYRYIVGHYTIIIYTDVFEPTRQQLFQCNIFDIYLHENGRYIYLPQDDRFGNYHPIKYGGYNSNGKCMPLAQLCELVKYLHKLSNLKAFA
jgi:hypothetical protein